MARGWLDRASFGAEFRRRRRAARPSESPSTGNRADRALHDGGGGGRRTAALSGFPRRAYAGAFLLTMAVWRVCTTRVRRQFLELLGDGVVRRRGNLIRMMASRDRPPRCKQARHRIGEECGELYGFSRRNASGCASDTSLSTWSSCSVVAAWPLSS